MLPNANDNFPTERFLFTQVCMHVCSVGMLVTNVEGTSVKHVAPFLLGKCAS